MCKIKTKLSQLQKYNHLGNNHISNSLPVKGGNKTKKDVANSLQTYFHTAIKSGWSCWAVHVHQLLFRDKESDL